MKRISHFTIAAPIALLLLAAAPNVFSDDHDKKTDVTITEPIEIPGAILQPGTYMFILLNSSSDRHIVEVKSEDGKHLYAMTFTAAARRVVPTGNVALTFYEMPAGAPRAIRQWYWPGDLEGQEFLYSKKEAARILAASHQTVSEYPESAQAELNSNVGDQTQSVQVAENTDQPPAPQVVEQPAPQLVETPQPVQQDQVVAQQAPPPADNSNSNDLVAQNYTPAPAPQSSDNSGNDNAALPQTASDLPLAGLIGLVSLASAVTLRLAARGRA